MKKRNYVFTNKKHSNRAIMSTILGIISTASLGIVIGLTYQKNGEATVGYGVTGVFATLYSLVGLALGVATVKEKEYYRLFPWLGIVLNLAALVLVVLILHFAQYY